MAGSWLHIILNNTFESVYLGDWGHSSVGKIFALQTQGHGFDPSEKGWVSWYVLLIPFWER